MTEFHELASDELRSAVHWYRSRAPEVSERFLAAVDRTIERIEADPESYPLIGRKHRYLRVSRFPYLLVYDIRPDHIIRIIAVAHTSRRSGYWQQRN